MASYASLGAGDNGNAPVTYESIVVHDPETRGNRLSSYQVYKITSTPANAENLYRRYSDFVWLAETLTSFYPGVFVPSLPPKKLFGKSEEFLLGRRRPALERFLNRVAAIPILAESCAFQMFMSRTHTFDDGQNEVKKLAANRTVQSIIIAYQYYYSEVISQPLPPSCDQDVIALIDFLKVEKERVGELVEHTDKLASTMSSAVALLNKVNASSQQLYTTEQQQQHLLNGNTRISILDNLVQWQVDAKEAEPAYSNHLLHHFEHEHEDVSTMLDVLGEREKLRSKFEKSKAKSAKWALASTKCDTEKQRTQREADIKAEEEDNVLLDAVTKLVLFDQFKSMWARKTEEYNFNMRSFAASETTLAQRAYQNWESVNRPE